MTDATFNSADQASVDNAAKEAARREAEDNETIRVWMNHRNGRDLLYRLVFDTCHMGRTFTALDDQGRSDALRTYLDLGERNIGAFIDERLHRFRISIVNNTLVTATQKATHHVGAHAAQADHPQLHVDSPFMPRSVRGHLVSRSDS